MRIAVYQGSGKPGEVATNLAAVAKAAHEAAGKGARLVIFPEAFLTGYNIGQRAHELAEPHDGPSPKELGHIAASAGIAILTGYYERAGDLVHNAAILVDRDGEVRANYRKCHLYGTMEKSLFSCGEGLTLATLDDFKVGILICYDIEFPEPARQLALSGAELIAVPTSLMSPGDIVATTMIPARACENQLFVAYANRIGREGDLDYVGQSCVAGPDGRTLVSAGRDEERLLYADLDRRAIAEARERYCYLEDRRPGLYAPPGCQVLNGTPGGLIT